MYLYDERRSAKINLDRLAKNIPSRLSQRENRFADKIKRSKTNPSKMLESLYSFMNELYRYVSEFTPCKKGCSDCCHYSVTVSEVEIGHIERYTKIKRRKEFLPKENFHGSPCPFLKEGNCSIYEARPFVCRRHIVLTNTNTNTNTWCNPKISNDETFPLLEFSSINDAFNHIREESESIELYDIRQIFGREALN